MSLETPNRLGASVVFFYALEFSLPPLFDNPEQVTITAAVGMSKLELIADEGEPPSLFGGFLVTLLNKITPDIGTWFMTGMPSNGSDYIGFTPSPIDMEDVEASAQEGDWINIEPEVSAPIGLISVTMWTTPPTDAQLPVELPIQEGS